MFEMVTASRELGLQASLNGTKTSSMAWAGPELTESFQVLGSGVALMEMKMIVRKSFVIGIHNTISSHFGQNGGSRN